MTVAEREKAKRVTYGIIYGLSAWGLGQGPAGLGIPVGQAQALITSFLNHFSGVRQLEEQLIWLPCPIWQSLYILTHVLDV